MVPHAVEMQERLFDGGSTDQPELSPQPGLMAASPEESASSALIQRSPTSDEGPQAEAEPPRLSRDEELLSTATKMYRLGFCFL